MTFADLLEDVLRGCSWVALGIMAPFSTWWRCLAYWDGSVCVHACACVFMCVTGGDGSIQLPCLCHWHFTLSLTCDEAPLLCLRPLFTPNLYPVHVQAVCLPVSTSLKSFISNGVVFPHT